MSRETVSVGVVAPGLFREAFQRLIASIPGLSASDQAGEVTVLIALQDSALPGGEAVPGRGVLVCGYDPPDLLWLGESKIEVLVSRHDEVEVLAQAIHAAHRGEAFCSPSLLPVLLRSLRGPVSSHSSAAAALSAQELAVARGAVQGLTNGEIGRKLELATATVKFHLKNTYRKLGIRRRAQLAAALRDQVEPGARAEGASEG